ncbi:hypothetical protein LPJ53_001177 [Coemansia erecta]|uniref:DUF4097 domain-containing protein n=1 Tax=Coemansia erecta TaxID=147472 RepID=A0A9W8CV75_9FUNG|nr:hypothetical protein LPJ53_001177 [Coemansia erecta]
MPHPKSHQKAHTRRGNGISKRRSQQQLQQAQHSQQVSHEPEEFPPLSDASDHQYMPPPYSANTLISISQDEFYHPASFPGYAAVQLANGEETQSLLPRVTHTRASDRYPQQQQQQQQQYGGYGRARTHIRRAVRRPRGRSSRCARCCGWLLGCICFALGAMIVGTFIAAVLFVSRHAFPPSWDWQCSPDSLVVHTDRSFTFALSPSSPQPLRIESIDGISVSDIQILRAGAGTADANVTVQAIVEASRGAAPDLVSIEYDDRLLTVRAVRPRWEWPRDCVRARLLVHVPAHADRLPQLPRLHIQTGFGQLRALDLGTLALGDLHVQMHSGSALLRDVGVLGGVHVLTSNGRINATGVAAGDGAAEFVSTNAALALDGIRATEVSVATTNGMVRAANVLAARRVVLHTANAPVVLQRVEGGHGVQAMTSNGSIRGNVAASSGTIGLTTTNAAVDVHVEGIGNSTRTVRVASTNASVKAEFTGIRGLFNVHTSNARVAVSGPTDLIRIKQSSTGLKSGSLGDASAGHIDVGSTNAQVNVLFNR